MKVYVRVLTFFLAILCICSIPLQVRADIAYYPEEVVEQEGEPFYVGTGDGTEPQNAEDEQQRGSLVLITGLWIAALVAVTCVLLLLLKRKR